MFFIPFVFTKKNALQFSKQDSCLFYNLSYSAVYDFFFARLSAKF